MIRLVRAEAHRLRSRRIAWVALIGVLLVLGAFQLIVWNEAKPPSVAEIAQRQADFEVAHKDWVEHHAEREAACLADGNSAQECAEPEPQPDPHTKPPAFDDFGPLTALVSIYLSAMAWFIVAGSFIGAEYTSGSIGNWLSFVPRRGRVFASKIVVIAVFGALFSAVCALVAVGATAGIISAFDGTFTGARTVAATAARGLLVSSILGCLGFCIGLVTRHTAAAVGTLLGYFFVFFLRNGILQGFGWAARLSPWMPEGNISALIHHGTTYQVPVQGSDTFEFVTKTITFNHALAYWGVVLALVIAGSALLFRHRDVS